MRPWQLGLAMIAASACGPSEPPACASAPPAFACEPEIQIGVPRRGGWASLEDEPDILQRGGSQAVPTARMALRARGLGTEIYVRLTLTIAGLGSVEETYGGDLQSLDCDRDDWCFLPVEANALTLGYAFELEGLPAELSVIVHNDEGQTADTTGTGLLRLWSPTWATTDAGTGRER